MQHQTADFAKIFFKCKRVLDTELWNVGFNLRLYSFMFRLGKYSLITIVAAAATMLR